MSLFELYIWIVLHIKSLANINVPIQLISMMNSTNDCYQAEIQK